MDRFSEFKKLLALIQHSEKELKQLPFNPFDILIAPIFLGGITTLRDPELAPRTTSHSRKQQWQLWLKRLKNTRRQYSLNKKAFKSSILFLLTEETHIKQMAPIWKELIVLQKSFQVITTKKKLYDQLKSIPNLDAIFVYPTLTNASSNTITHIFNVCNEFLDKYPKPVGPFGKVAQTIIRNSLNYIYFLHSQFDKVSSKNIKAVIVGYDITVEGRLMTRICKAKGIKSYCIMHGSVTGEPLDTVHIVDSFLLFGKNAKQDLISKGSNPDMLQVVGAPYLDELKPELLMGNHKRFRQLFNIPEDKQMIVVAHSGAGHSTSIQHYRMFLVSIINFATKFSNIEWGIKLHRKDSIANIESLIGKIELSNVFIIEHDSVPTDITIFDIISGGIAILTGNSTVALESMFLNVPVITLDLCNEYTGVDMISQQATFHCKNEKEVECAINQILKKDTHYKLQMEKSHQFVDTFFYREAGTTASQTIAKTISANT